MTTPPDVSSSQLLATMLDASSDVVLVLDAHGHVHDLRSASERLLGRPRSSWIGTHLVEHVHPEDRTMVVDRLADVWSEDRASSAPLVFRAAHARGYWATLSMSSGRHVDGGDRWAILVVLRDVTQHEHTERRLLQTVQELDFVAGHDPRTGLPNQQILRARLGALLRRIAFGADRPPCLILIRLLGLDELGRRHGDDAVAVRTRSFAQDVREEVGGAAFVASEGNGDLVVVTDPGGGLDDARDLAARLAELARSRPAGDEPIDLDVAIGVSALRPGRTATAALGRVKRAATEAASKPRPRSPVVDPAPDGVDERPWPTPQRVRAAFEAGELEVWYQPIDDTRSGRLVGFESTLRWVRPDAGVLTAGEFLPRVEGTDVMLDIDRFVLTEGFRELARWQARCGGAAPTLSVDISTSRLHDLEIAELLREESERASVDLRGLCLEVTDTHLVVRRAEAARQLRGIRRLGVRLALADFGTGSSSLHHLGDLGADELKIDQAFIALLGDDPGATAIVRASVEMGAAFGMTSTADGVTTPEQRRFLQLLGCDRVQGSLIGPAVPPRGALGIVEHRVDGRTPPDAEVLHRVERTRHELSQLDGHYRPSDEEIAVLADTRPDVVRASASPPRPDPIESNGADLGNGPGTAGRTGHACGGRPTAHDRGAPSA